MRTLLFPLIILALAPAASAAVTIPPPAPVPPVPHVETNDAAKVAEVRSALDAIFTAQGLASAASYDVPSLSCQLLTVPFAPQTYSCNLTVVTTDGATKTLQVQDDGQTKTQAQTLFSALNDAGATYLDDPHYFRTTLEDLRVSSEQVSFDDKSKWQAPPSPNVRVTGDVAGQLLAALGQLDLDDSDRTLFVICANYSETPDCSYQIHNRPGPKLDAATSAALWTAFKDAATAVGFKPYGGTVAQMTIINAGNFSYDGTTLGFVLVGDDSTPPPPPATHR